jgi:hypothetical protein
MFMELHNFCYENYLLYLYNYEESKKAFYVIFVFFQQDLSKLF